MRHGTGKEEEVSRPKSPVTPKLTKNSGNPDLLKSSKDRNLLNLLEATWYEGLPDRNPPKNNKTVPRSASGTVENSIHVKDLINKFQSHTLT